ncbi:MAG: DUF4249 domain-containing protein [Bacteroidales bacterium]|nr:DUF4249 domain-containing protein [Bacteroidales bacterium]
MKRQLLCIVAIALVAAGCEKTLDINDDGNHQLVLNAIPSADSMAFVYFAQTRFFLDSSNNHPVNGATLTLTVNGTPYTPSSANQCIYRFPYQLQEGDELEFDASVGDRSVHAATYVPRFPDVQDVQSSYFASPSFNFAKVDFRLDDHASLDEYYNIVVTERDSGARYNQWTASIDTVDTVRTAYFLLPYNPEITSSEVNAYRPLAGYLYSRAMFTDKLIDGRQTPIQLFIIQTVDTNEIAPFKHEYFIDIESITPARWNYIVSAAQQGGGFDFFAEPGEVWGNIDGALGIFAGASRRHFAFDPDTLQPSH